LNKGIIGIFFAVGIGILLIALLIQNWTEPQPGLQKDNHLGLVIHSPLPSTTISELKQVYSQGSNTGIGRSNVYLFWSNIEPNKGEYNWGQTDVLMSLNKLNDLKVTLYFSVINGKLLGPFPDWLKHSVIGKNLEVDLSQTLDAILSRYPIIDSVILAGETDTHFRYEENKIPAFVELFKLVNEKIKKQHPDVKIGNSFSLHGVLNKELEHVVEKLALGDFVAFTYFPVDRLNDINKNPQEAVEDLEKIFTLVPEKKIAFFEISWSTGDFVGGNSEDQQEFLKLAFDFYRKNESKFEFFTWYRQYDRPAGTCLPDLNALDISISIGGTTGIGSSEFVAERVGEYICNAGLIDVEGNPKIGWNEFTQQIKLSIKS